MENNKTHWENIYKNSSFKSFSWYQEKPNSVKIINDLNLSKNSKIIDVGAGASFLAKNLIENGYKNLTINDISLESLKISKKHNLNKMYEINYIVGDITKVNIPLNYYNLWHDRAVFHFLTNAIQRKKYIKQILKSVVKNGYLIISAFSFEGPKKCSSLPIVQYNETNLSLELGKNFKLINFNYYNHFTPSRKKQNFISCCFKVINKI